MMAAAALAGSPRGYHVQYVDNIAVLILNNNENRFNQKSVERLLEALDQVESNESAKALVIIGVGKFFSNGLDLEWLSKQSSEAGLKFFATLQTFDLRIATFPMPTIAALNGHAFAMGGLLALLCDCRVMRTKQGWFCLPEIHLKLQFSTMLIDLIRLKGPSPNVIRDMVLFGKRYTAEEAYKVGLAEAICDESDLLDCACKVAKQCIGKNGLDRDMLKQMKLDLYGSILEKTSMKEDLKTPKNLESYKDAATSKL